ncbi:MAG: hypothetical protein HZA54_02215 [Planctomycetes bacterium]|nr:hypothetical protein [Planctomycetota bacterium]
MPDDPIPDDLTSLLDAPMERIAPLLDRASASTPERRLGRLTGLLIHRTLHLLRRGARSEVADEALTLHRSLAAPSADPLRAAHPQIVGSWNALADLLSEAARRSDPAAVDSILASYPKHGRRLLEILAAGSGAVPRAQIKQKLSISESQLSHLLRDLEEADLLVRHRPEGSKTVLVGVGAIGREFVRDRLLPPWVKFLVAVLERIADSPFEAANAAVLETELIAAGAPSPAAAALARAAAALRPPAAPFAGASLNAQVREEDPHFNLISIDNQDRHPVWAFSPSPTLGSRGSP